MELLSFEGGSKRPRNNKKTTKVMAAIGAMAVFAALGSTLAANITINSGSSVQFGQGLTGAAACSATMTVAPQDTFTNGSSTSGTFYLNGVNFSNMVSGGCANDTITVRAWDTNASDSPLALESGLYSLDIPMNGSGVAQNPYNEAGITVSNTGPTGFNVNIATPTANSANVAKLTVESHQ
jgi:hypothetical protein